MRVWCHDPNPEGCGSSLTSMDRWLPTSFCRRLCRDTTAISGGCRSRACVQLLASFLMEPTRNLGFALPVIAVLMGTDLFTKSPSPRLVHSTATFPLGPAVDSRISSYWHPWSCSLLSYSLFPSKCGRWLPCMSPLWKHSHSLMPLI